MQLLPGSAAVCSQLLWREARRCEMHVLRLADNRRLARSDHQSPGVESTVLKQYRAARTAYLLGEDNLADP